MLKKVIYKWERKLAQRDNNRVVRPFEWGHEFLSHDIFSSGKTSRALATNGNGALHHNGHANGHGAKQLSAPTLSRFPDIESGDTRAALQAIFDFNKLAIAESDTFFSAPPVQEFFLDDNWLTFASAQPTPYAENNTVHARYFPVPPRQPEAGDSLAQQVARARGRAVLVLPHWNAKIDEHVAVCRLLNRVGIAALRLSLPYHDRRMLTGFERADYIVSANLGRTLQANRQAVLDCRSAIDWLIAQGYGRIGILGTSLGSCIAFLTYVHDQRIKVGFYNHVSSYFGDVVWDGITTAHVRRGLEAVITKEDLRNAWLAISPNAYVHRLQGNRRRGLLLSARYDLSFTPELSQLLFAECDKHDTNLERAILPCGHYSLGRSPYKYYAGFLFARYFRRHL
ncbi:MAG: abhydrolase domain-containing 18 [Acidobacteria bacterium]|nr:abhydrolase domain-containing 18 [Acidobacteriota bacterium]